MSEVEDAHYDLGRDRAKLINQRLLEMFETRSKCERARALEGVVPSEYRLAMHNAIRDVYLAIRPLRDEGAVADWWDDARLSPRWGDWEETDESDERAVLVEMNGDEVYAKWVPYEGIGHLDQLRDIATAEQRETNVVGGVKTETVQVPSPLDYDILLDISTTLEDASRRLGFVPETSVPDNSDPSPV